MVNIELKIMKNKELLIKNEIMRKFNYDTILTRRRWLILFENKR